jgi:hypothetical protein
MGLYIELQTSTWAWQHAYEFVTEEFVEFTSVFPARQTINSELKRTKGIRLFNKNKAL